MMRVMDMHNGRGADFRDQHHLQEKARREARDLWAEGYTEDDTVMFEVEEHPIAHSVLLGYPEDADLDKLVRDRSTPHRGCTPQPLARTQALGSSGAANPRGWRRASPPC